jgi:hypothetical protein
MTCETTNINIATPANFRLVFPKLPQQSTLAANNELILNTYGVILPSLNLNFEEVAWQGSKRKVANNQLEFEQLQTQFLVDSQFLNWVLLYEWMTYISDNKDKMAELYQNYAVDASLLITDNFKNEIIKIVFVGMWPLNLQEVSFSMREGEVFVESGATFIYDYFEVRNI